MSSSANSMTFYLRLLWAIVSNAVIGVVTWVLLDLPGYCIVPFILLKEREVFSRITHVRIVTGPRSLWLWCNDQEGNYPAWYAARTPGWPKWLRGYVWLAWRNPSNNLRFVDWFSPPISIFDTHVFHRANMTLLQAGWRTRLIIDIGRRYSLLAGFKLAEHDETIDWQVYGVGFGIRLKRY